MCVLRHQIDFIDVFIQAGATSKDPEDALFRTLQDPYGESKGRNDNNNDTCRLLRTLLKPGAEPNTIGRK